MADLSERIETVANKPAAASGDAGSVTQQKVSDLIDADRYLAQKEAAAKAHGGLRFSKIVPPGAV